MSILKKLFSVGRASDAKEPLTEVYKGYTIRAMPEAAGDQYRLAGEITHQAETGLLVRTFLRADLFPGREQAEQFCLSKGRQIIDEQGERLFRDGSAQGRV